MIADSFVVGSIATGPLSNLERQSLVPAGSLLINGEGKGQSLQRA